MNSPDKEPDLVVQIDLDGSAGNGGLIDFFTVGPVLRPGCQIMRTHNYALEANRYRARESGLRAQ